MYFLYTCAAVVFKSIVNKVWYTLCCNVLLQIIECEIIKHFVSDFARLDGFMVDIVRADEATAQLDDGQLG